jgi:Mlc titration factor MtfA (ptsG expression regulator)
MTGGEVATAIAVGAVLMAGVYGIVRLSRRLWRFLPATPGVRFLDEPVPDNWPAIIHQRVPLTRRLGPEERHRLLRLAQLLLHEVPIDGCNGLVVTETMRVTIAATACLLLLDLPYPRFPTLRRILLYPDAFVPRRARSPLDRGRPAEPGPLLGEAHDGGIVILSWDSVHDRGDGHNVVLHEFAHILDAENGAFDGVPFLEGASLAEWGRVLADEFAHAQEAAELDEEPALDDYAATNRAEFFAVATEAFFEEPDRLRQRLPEVYEQLRRFYRPAT